MGRAVSEAALAAGNEVVGISHRAGRGPPRLIHRPADTVTGEGLAAALAGAEVIVDAVNSLRDAERVLDSLHSS